MLGQEVLVRKQFLITEKQVEKIERLAKAEGTSVAEVVRLAIDAYDPLEASRGMEAPELMALVQSRLKEAIESTRKATEVVGAALEKISGQPSREAPRGGEELWGEG